MTRYRAAIHRWALIAGLLAPSAAPAENLDAESVFRDARQYTVRIRTQIEWPFVEDTRGAFEGSGFLVDAERGWIVTNAHVAGHCPSSVQVAFLGRDYQTARKLYVDTFSDIAVLQVPRGAPGRKPAKMDCDHEVRAGEELGVFGHPRGLPFTATRGIVSGHTDQFGPSFIQTDAVVDHGNSGGPVMRVADGAVIGVATAMIGDAKSAGSNFVTPAREVCRVLELLRKGVPPDAVEMPFSLLLDEDGRHTLRVGTSHDPERWPFQPGDAILGIEGEDDAPRNLSDFVTALRGRAGSVRLRVDRQGKPVTVIARPRPRPSLLARWGVSVDGVLIAASPYDDGNAVAPAPRLLVHSVQDGTIGASLDVQRLDLVESVNGRRFDDVQTLLEYLQAHKAASPIRLVLRRWSPDDRRIFDYQVRELPGEEIEVIKHADEKVAAN